MLLLSTVPSARTSATVAAPTVRGLPPYSLLRRMRNRAPPALRCITCRIVWLLNANGMGPKMGGGTLAMGEAAKLVIHSAACAQRNALTEIRVVMRSLRSLAFMLPPFYSCAVPKWRQAMADVECLRVPQGATRGL